VAQHLKQHQGSTSGQAQSEQESLQEQQQGTQQQPNNFSLLGGYAGIPKVLACCLAQA
jgi:hypothetical protein